MCILLRWFQRPSRRHEHLKVHRLDSVRSHESVFNISGSASRETYEMMFSGHLRKTSWVYFVSKIFESRAGCSQFQVGPHHPIVMEILVLHTWTVACISRTLSMLVRQSRMMQPAVRRGEYFELVFRNAIRRKFRSSNPLKEIIAMNVPSLDASLEPKREMPQQVLVHSCRK